MKALSSGLLLKYLMPFVNYLLVLVVYLNLCKLFVFAVNTKTIVQPKINFGVKFVDIESLKRRYFRWTSLIIGCIL